MGWSETNTKDYLMNRVHHLHQAEWNDWSILFKHSVCCCEKHFKRGESEWGKNITGNLAHHLHVAFLFLHVCACWAECMWFNMDASWLELRWFLSLTHSVILWLWGSAGEGLGSKFIWCHWSKDTPWHEHETSTGWQMCCTATEEELHGCQLAVLWGFF